MRDGLPFLKFTNIMFKTWLSSKWVKLNTVLKLPHNSRLCQYSSESSGWLLSSVLSTSRFPSTPFHLPDSITCAKEADDKKSDPTSFEKAFIHFSYYGAKNGSGLINREEDGMGIITDIYAGSLLLLSFYTGGSLEQIKSDTVSN